LKGKIKLEGTSDVTLNELPVTLTSTGAAGLTSVTGNLILKLGGEEYTESVSVDTSPSTITFDSLDYTIEAGSTVSFSVLADINDIDAGTLDEGDTLAASVTSTNVSHVDAENSQGDQLADSTEKSGTATGNAQEFRTMGIAVTLLETTQTAQVGSSAGDDIGNFTIKFKVTAVGSDVYVASNALWAAATDYSVDRSGTATTGGVSAVIVNNTDTDTTSAGNWFISEDSSETFTLTVQKVHSGNSGLYRANLLGVKWDDADAGPFTLYSSNMDTFHTNYISLD
jgi:hypothetical protein